MVIAMGGKGGRVALRHNLAGRILDEDAPDRAGLEDNRAPLETLAHQIVVDGNQEGGGAGAETVVERLPRHAQIGETLEGAGELVEGSQPGDHGTQEGL